MALIIPTHYTSFGDATSTEGPSRKYVLAQFRSTAPLEWVAELRRRLGLRELKYAAFKQARPSLRNDEHLWSRIEAGISAATIVVVDTTHYSTGAFFQLWEEKECSGLDTRDAEIGDLVAHAIVARTPIAYLPAHLVGVSGTLDARQVANLEDFAPDSIRQQIGRGVRPALVFAARAHAVFDVDALRKDRDAASTRDAFNSPLAHLVLTEVLSAQRRFDVENAKSLQVINSASKVIADALFGALAGARVSAGDLATELSSTEGDGLQAADLAAGWARDVLEVSNARALASQFETVLVNGVRVMG